MHSANSIVDNFEQYQVNLKKRGFDISEIDKVLELNKQRKQLTTEVEKLRSQVKSSSKEIGALKKAGEDASLKMEEVGHLKSQIEVKNNLLDEVNNTLNNVLACIPNLIDENVPVGKSDEDNLEVKRWGEIKDYSFKPLEHWDLGERLGMLDFESGAKLSGARFVVYRSQLAKLERALINFFLDQHEKAGYEELITPYIVNKETMYGTGQLPKFEDDLFKIDDERDWYLIPTAEVTLTNLKRGELFPREELPLKYTGFTPCFRSEAGSYGKDTKGLIRLHQFNKVEMVNIVEAEKSEEAHEAMVRQAELMLELLELPYRTMLLCSGDIGFGARKCFDLEVWLPGQQKYREISSVSNCWDFQARRASIRYRGEDNKPKFAHTLNGSGLAVGRTLLAIMENYQQEDGSILVPKVLAPYMGGVDKISKK